MYAELAVIIRRRLAADPRLAAVAGRVHPQRFPQAGALPAISYRLSIAESVTRFDTPPAQALSVQVDVVVVGHEYQEVLELADGVLESLDGHTDQEDDVRVQRILLASAADGLEEVAGADQRTAWTMAQTFTCFVQRPTP